MVRPRGDDSALLTLALWFLWLRPGGPVRLSIKALTEHLVALAPEHEVVASVIGGRDAGTVRNRLARYREKLAAPDRDACDPTW
jgi:hypothetical protein